MKRMLLLVLLLALGLSLSFAQWTEYTKVGTDSVKYLQMRGVDYKSNGVVWVTGAEVLYTGKNSAWLSTDFGTTWARKDIYTNATLSSLGVVGIAAKDANTAFVATTTGEIIRTTNGGAKWDTAYSYSTPDSAFFDGIRYVGQDSLVAYGDADGLGVCVVRSLNGGVTWTRITNLPDSGRVAAGYIGYATYGQGMEVYGKNVWLPLYWGTSTLPGMLYSADAGATWTFWKFTLQGGNTYNYYLRSIAMKDANVGYGSSRQITSSSTTANYLVKTTDGGRTWSDTISVAPGIDHAQAKVTGVEAIQGTNTVIAVGFTPTSAKAWISTDNAATWNSLNCPGGVISGADLKNIYAVNASNFFAVGYKNISKYGNLTDVDESPKGTPTSYALLQNYPNPFNPSTTISYSVPKSGYVEIKVHDMLGRLVATLVQGEQSVGTHSVSFNASNLSSGAYFYTMRAGDFVSTKSLMLLK
jgi:hypothetical protein